MQSILSALGVTAWFRGSFPGVTALLLAFTITGSQAACGGSDAPPTGPGGGSKTGPASAAVFDGNNQEAAPGAVVGTPPAVVVKAEDGSPVANVNVTFDVTAGGGSVTGGSATTNAQGVARVGSWTLGPAAGANKLTASVAGITQKVNFSATARQQQGAQRKWTVLVYMAADNDLAIPGILDIDEMEEANLGPDVQVVVQAEFNPTAVKQVNNCDYRCFNRPNWNTFRYAVQSGGQERNGPNGAAIDIGNRNMTDPAQLREFIQWGQQNYPAEHYAVVLWNHGGGYTGLLQDITSAGGHLMSVADLRTALQTAGAQIDLLAFDMCLMGGYETLAKVKGFADFVVFSEEVVPGEGFPYKQVLSAFKERASQPVATIATEVAARFHASYANNKASTTISAFDMGRYASFETGMNALAVELTAKLATVGPDIAATLGETQKYTYPELTDLADFLTRLRARTADAALRTKIDGVLAGLNGFRLGSHARNGTGRDAADVSRSTGLHVVLPSGQGNDRLSDAGPRSLAAYQALYPNAAWTAFLAAWLNARPTDAVTDFGEQRFQSYLVWDPASVENGVDVDYWILEPDGNLYVPAAGSVTPNGTLTNDSYEDGTYYEGYQMNRFVRNGTYKFYAYLYADPEDFRPRYDMLFRFGTDTELASLLGNEVRRLSKQRPVANDPNATWEKVRDSAYTDLRFLAGLAVGPQGGGGGQAQAAGRSGVMASRAGGVARVSVATADDGRHPTAAQIATARRLADAAHARLRRQAPAAASSGTAPRAVHAAGRSLGARRAQ